MDIFSWGGEGGLESCKERPNIFILVAFYVRTFVVGGRGGGENILKIGMSDGH